MKKDRSSVEREIVREVRQSPSSRPMDIVKKVFSNPTSADVQTAREAFRALVSRGDLQVTRDLELRVYK